MKKLFVVGDSISIHYGPFLKQMIAGRFNYGRKGEREAIRDLDKAVGANGGDSNMVLDYLQTALAAGNPGWDVLLLNCGLHDLKTAIKDGSKQVALSDYHSNLIKICSLVHKQNITLIWVRTTPVNDERHNSLSTTFYRYNRDVIEYNQVADEIMDQLNIPSIDLYGLTQNLGREIYDDHVHFKEDIRPIQAAFIAGYLETFYK